MDNAGKDLHLWAMRMNWLRWLARPLVSVWYGLVFAFQYFWHLVRVVTRAVRDSFSLRYWTFCLFGLAIAIFFAFSFWFLSVKLGQPWLAWLGVLFAILPVGWAMAEISSRERRRLAMDDEYHEDSLYLGNGLKAVRILLKYVILSLFLVVLLILGTLLLAVPQIGSLLYTIVLVPLVAVSIFAVACLILIAFGLAVFPSHVLFALTPLQGSFIRRLFRESAQLLGIVRKNFFRYVFVSIPAGLAVAVLVAVPVAIIAGGYLLSLLVTDSFGSMTGVMGSVTQQLLAWSQNVVSGVQDPMAALSAVFAAISLAHIFAAMLAPALSFLSCMYFRLYIATHERGRAWQLLVERMRALWGLRPDLADDGQTVIDEVTIPGVDLLSTEDMRSLRDDQEREDATWTDWERDAGNAAEDEAAWLLPAAENDFSDELQVVDEDEDVLSGYGKGPAPAVAGTALVAGAAAMLASDEFTESPMRSGTGFNDGSVAGDDEERLTLGDVDSPEIDGSTLLDSIESSMPLSDEIVPMDGVEPDEDDRLLLDDLETGVTPVSGNEDDILGSITSSMDIAAEPVPMSGIEPDEDDRLLLDDLETGVTPVSDDEDDILGSITSSMDIAAEPVPMSGIEPDDDDRLLLNDLDTGSDEDDVLRSITETMSLPDEPVPMDGLKPDEDDVLPELNVEDAGRVSQEVDDLIASLDRDLALNGSVPILDPAVLERENEEIANLDVDQALGLTDGLPAEQIIPAGEDDQENALRLDDLDSMEGLSSAALDGAMDAIMGKEPSGSDAGLSELTGPAGVQATADTGSIDDLLAEANAVFEGGLSDLDLGTGNNIPAGLEMDTGFLGDEQLDDILDGPASFGTSLEDQVSNDGSVPPEEMGLMSRAGESSMDELLASMDEPDSTSDDLLGGLDTPATDSVDDLLGGSALRLTTSWVAWTHRPRIRWTTSWAGAPSRLTISWVAWTHRPRIQWTTFWAGAPSRLTTSWVAWTHRPRIQWTASWAGAPSRLTRLYLVGRVLLQTLSPSRSNKRKAFPRFPFSIPKAK